MRNETFRILAVLTDGAAPPGELLDRIEARTHGDAPALATFYRRLKEAVDEGWITPEDTTGQEGGPGRPARTFRITDAGLAAARSEASRARAFSDLVLRSEERTG